MVLPSPTPPVKKQVDLDRHGRVRSALTQTVISSRFEALVEQTVILPAARFAEVNPGADGSYRFRGAPLNLKLDSVLELFPWLWG